MRAIIPFLLILIVLLAACGSEGTLPAAESEAAAGAASHSAAGQELFQQMIVNSAPGCTTCHSLEPGVTQVGPSLAGIAERAGERVANLSAEEYLRQSIIKPDAYVVENFSNVMYQSYTDALSDEQIDDLVAYLLTVTSE